MDKGVDPGRQKKIGKDGVYLRLVLGIFFGHFQPLLDTLTVFGDFWRTFLKISAVCRNLTHQHQFESFFGTVGLFCAIFFGPLDKPGHWTWGGREIAIVIFALKGLSNSSHTKFISSASCFAHILKIP